MDWNFLTLLKTLISSLSNDPAFMLLGIVIVGIGYILIKTGKKLSEVIIKKLDDVSVKAEKIDDDLKIHTVKTEFRIEQVEKRIERLENLLFKED